MSFPVLEGWRIIQLMENTVNNLKHNPYIKESTQKTNNQYNKTMKLPII